MRSSIMRLVQPPIALATGAILVLAGQVAQATSPSFTDQSSAAGINFLHQPIGDVPVWPQFGGGTVGDFNADGYPDIYLLGGGARADALYINDGDGTFTDRAVAWGLDTLHRGVGAAAFDYDNDGWVDLMVTTMGDAADAPNGASHKLFRNTGAGTFVDVADTAGVSQTNGLASDRAPVFGDYNLDGKLDLFIAGWDKNSGPEVPTGNRLFMNNGDGTFSQTAVAAGVMTDRFLYWGGVFADMDGDRWPELMVPADIGTSHYFVNNRDGTFTRTYVYDPDIVWNAMGNTIGDFDRDARSDWYVTSVWPSVNGEGPDGNRLYLNYGANDLLATPPSAGVDDGGFGWGTVAVDTNHDGWLDIVETNGWAVADQVTGHEYTGEQAYLFMNDGNSGSGITFSEGAIAAGIDYASQGRGLYNLDYDLDGDMDLVFLTNAGPARLYRNDLCDANGCAGNDTNWIQIKLDVGANPNLSPEGWGALVRINHNGVQQSHRMHSAANYLGHGELIAHFGVGADTLVEELRIVWADGFHTVLNNVPVNTRYNLVAKVPLLHGPFVRGETTTMTVRGLKFGEIAYFFMGTEGEGFAEGLCLAQFGGLCRDLLGNSVLLLGQATADETGTAVLDYAVPTGLDAPTVWTQVMVPRGTDGRASFKSNVSEVAVLATNPVDTDADGVLDLSDNCRDVSNANQLDADADGIGNACDADLTQNCLIDFEDLSVLKERMFSDDAAADFDGDGNVSFLDLQVMKDGFFGAPGPSGTANICDAG